MPDTPSPSQRDDRLERILADYLHAVEAGTAPDRAGLLKQYPDLAADLGSFFRNRDAMERLAEPIKGQMPALAETIGGPESPSARVGAIIRYFGDYELLEEIARGGMGVVYRARQKSLNRIVALKTILSGQLASEADVARFQAEAEAAANLDHPNILPIFEVGKHEEQQYFSMKLIEGGSLADWIANCRLQMADFGNDFQKDLARLVAVVARAVHHAHQRGILHRDLKPGNILLEVPEKSAICNLKSAIPWITDFGLAKRTEADSGLTRTGAVVGTPSYMPPEQARADKQVTTAADIYALGAILYELLTGRPPFRAGTVHETIQQVMEKEPDHPRTHNPVAHRDLSAIALKCLQKAPENRYESASALADHIDRWLNGEATQARPPSFVGQAWRWLRRNTGAAAGVVLLGTAAGLTPVLVGFALLGSIEVYSYLYPPNMGQFNLLRLIQFTSQEPAGRIGTFAAAAVLALAIGWLVKLVARPRTTQIALAAAASTGLIATLVAFWIVGPTFGSELPKIQELRLHPISVQESYGHYNLTPSDVDYLKQYLPPNHSAAGSNDYVNMLHKIHVRAENTNQFYAGLIVGGASLAVLFVFFLGLCLESTWAADYLSGSGRGRGAQIVCYLELYLPAAALLLCILVVLVRIFRGDQHGGPP